MAGGNDPPVLRYNPNQALKTYITIGQLPLFAG
jgi:hypothetical protein